MTKNYNLDMHYLQLRPKTTFNFKTGSQEVPVLTDYQQLLYKTVEPVQESLEI